MKIEVVHDLPVPPDEVLVWVSDLARYPQWTNLLHRVDVEAGHPGSARAWSVELRGKIGPFARSKRLRMRQVPGESARHIRFERDEGDGIDHGVWIFDVQVAPVKEGAGSTVSVVFEYEGRLWSGAIERLLRDEIESSKKRLIALVTAGDQSADHAP